VFASEKPDDASEVPERGTAAGLVHHALVFADEAYPLRDFIACAVELVPHPVHLVDCPFAQPVDDEGVA